jgi:hypothetical protein
LLFFSRPHHLLICPQKGTVSATAGEPGPTLRGVAILGKRQKQGPPLGEAGLFNKFRRRPTFPHSDPCSIIGAVGLNFCVRDGNRCDPYAIATENRTTGFQLPKTVSIRCTLLVSIHFHGGRGRGDPRPLPHEKLFMVKPHGQLVPVS